MAQLNGPSWWKSNTPIKLPVPFKNIQVLLQILGEEYLDYRKLAVEIGYYPSITARLICLANSSWSSPSMPISDIEQACLRLGTSVVRSVSIAMVIANSFDPGRCKRFDVERFWLSSMLVAEAAALLTAKLPALLKETFNDRTAHTAGVLHLIGLLWLADNLPLETSQALQQVVIDNTISLNEALQQTVKTDYCQVGGWIGEQWNMPEPLVIAMQYHRDSNYQGAFWEIAILMGIATKLVAAVISHVEQAPEITACEHLQISREDQEKTYARILAKLEPTLELSRMLFG